MKRKRASVKEKPEDTSTTIKKGKQADSEIERNGYGGILSNPNALTQIITSVIKEITKESGGLANLSRSLVGNSVNNGQMKQPHADMEENQSQHHRNPDFKQKEELNAALKVIRKTMKLESAGPFSKPVDPIALGIPDYFDVIKTPMDFGTICNNLENGIKYKNSGDVLKDVEFIWYNCTKYNKKGDVILELMKRVKTQFTKYWKAAGLQIEQSQPIVESSRNKKQEKDNPQTPLANKSTQLLLKGSNPTQSPESQPGQSSNLLESSSSSSEEEDEPNPDSRIIKKKQKCRGPTRAHELFNSGVKIPITTNELGQPVGPGAAKLTTFIGVISRDTNFCPLNHTWHKMPQENKENMWQKVLSKFEIDPNCRKWVLLSIRNKWRTFKSRLKVNHYDVHETDEERLADRDERVPPDQWAALVSLWSSEKSQHISAKLKACASRVKFRHTTGPKSYARIREEERAKRPDGQEPSQAELFILTHTRKDGKPTNEATAAVITQLCEETSCNKDKTEDEAYNRVMEPYKHGGMSLLGAHLRSSSKSLKVVVEEKNKEILELKERVSLVEKTCEKMAAQVAELVAIVKGRENSTNHVNGEMDLGDDDEVLERQTRGRKKRLLEDKSTSNGEVLAKKVDPTLTTPTPTSNHEVPERKTRGRPKKK